MVAVDFVLQQLDGMAHARIAGDGGRIEKRSPDEYELRAECERFQYIGAAAYAAVHHDRHAARLLDDAGQYAQWSGRAIQLAPAVIGDDDAVDGRSSRAMRASSLLRMPFMTRRPFHSLRISSTCGHDNWSRAPAVALAGTRDERRARPHVFEMRHALVQQCAQKHADEPARMQRRCPTPNAASGAADG